MVNRYRIVRRLAAGGMAEVLLAIETLDDGSTRTVVIKRVLEHLVHEREFLAMFEREARLAMQLRHPNVVDVLASGANAGVPYLVMEALDGADLRTILRVVGDRGDRLDVAIACAIAADVARGLHHAHTLRSPEGKPLGVVHRDVSPHNVFLTRDGRVKVLDFGIAKSAEHLTVTRSGVFRGKLGYAAPEQIAALKTDGSADLFALGVVLWEMLAGRRLWYRENELAMVRAIAEESPPVPSSVVPGVPPVLDAIVMALLAKLPVSRPTHGEEVARALDGVARSLGFVAGGSAIAQLVARYAPDPTLDVPDGHVEAAVASADLDRPVAHDGDTVRSDKPADTPANERRISRSRSLRFASVMAGIAITLGIGFAGWSMRKRSADPPAVVIAAPPVPAAAPDPPARTVVAAQPAAIEPPIAVDNTASSAAPTTPTHTGRRSRSGRGQRALRVLGGGAINDYP